MLDFKFFNKKRDEQVKELFDELKQAWSRIETLENSIKDYQRIDEKTVHYQQKKASEYRNKTEKIYDQATELASSTNLISIEINDILAKATESKELINRERISSEEHSRDVLLLVKNLQSKVKAIEELDLQHPNLENDIISLEENITKASESKAKIEQLLKFSTSARSEIKEKYDEVFGFTSEDAEGKEIENPGLVDQLENSYDDLKERIDSSKKQLNDAIQKASEKASEAEILIKEGAEKQLKYREDEFITTQKRIETLLPGALAAGLAEAYSKKVEKETLERNTHRDDFQNGIWLMVFIAIIPLIVSIVFLVQGTQLDEVINRLPKVSLATLFLYVAAVWKTAAAGKRQRLSKRLIEEYSHKEAQSRTFVGLSQQISDLGDDELSQDLKLKLLYNLVQISSENPGKLITDYKKSDHPIYELSEQSAKLAGAIEKVKQIPGGEFIGEILQGKRDRIASTVDTKTQEGLAAATTIQDSHISKNDLV